MAAPQVDPIVYVVDDHPPAIALVEVMLRSAGHAVQSFTSPRTFLATIDQAARGCVLLDARMPEVDGPNVQRLLIAQGVTLPVIFMSGESDISTAVSVMRSGAVDFIEKPVQRQVLIGRVEEALRVDATQTVNRQIRTETASRAATLSPREQEVMELIASGSANKQVGFQLGISERTVEVHRARVMSKMCVASLAELVQARSVLNQAA